ncbi:histidine kinase [Sporosarcina sp. ANT_H38]|uniref:ATP-binding protein n=1 Tax=Sporosarcina sp. ANT_H38 TaxID=2597358 RepID=UPI00165EA5F8|nr:ATP-binding protein [Sporosarcina sp. ANT_H38]
MKYQTKNVMKHITFILDDAIRPGAVFGLEGTLLYVNDSFHKEFVNDGTGNIRELFIMPPTNLWDDIISDIKKTGNKTIDVNIRLGQNRISSVRMHLEYLDDDQQVIALFDVPQKFGDIAEKTYIQAFRNSDSFMVVMNRDGLIYDVNDQHSTFFNLPKKYFLGKSAEVILKLFPEDPESLINYYKDINLYGFAEKITRYDRSEDGVRYYQVTTLYDCETQVYLVRMNDRTEEMAMKNSLAHTNSLSTIGQLAASIAHEIRNPMTTLKGFVQLLKISATKDAMKYLSVIDEEVDRMESILSEMLVLSKPGQNERTTFSLGVLVADMIQVIYPKALMDGITITQKGNILKDSLINGDSDKIKQVLLNLFKNGIEAMTPGGNLSVFVSLDSPGKVVLGISDNGKGMDTEQVKQIFIPFFTTKSDGSGLGLPFVLKYIEEHGGTITVESEVDIGTTFIVTLPSAIRHDSATDTTKKRVHSP